MRRSYRQSKFLGIIERVRAAMPDAAITTDIIVGFPGETEEDFQATLDVVRRARFSGAFTFQYSKRPGTPAATLPDQLPKAVVQERYMRLVAVADEVAWAENRALEGRRRRADGRRGGGPQGRRDPPALRPRARQPAGALHARPGGRLARRGPSRRHGRGVITYGAPHHLVADGPVRLGPPYPRRRRLGEPHRHPRRPGSRSGLPTIGVPAALPVETGCSR